MASEGLSAEILSRDRGGDWQLSDTLGTMQATRLAHQADRAVGRAADAGDGSWLSNLLFSALYLVIGTAIASLLEGVPADLIRRCDAVIL